MPLYRVILEDLIEILNPLDGEMWKCGEISESEIRRAFSNSATEDRSWDGANVVSEIETLKEARAFHINRIATLMRQESEFDRIMLILENHTSPIKVRLSDGNHRLAAAYVRGDDSILAIIAASHPAGISDVLPSAVRLDGDNAE